LLALLFLSSPGLAWAAGSIEPLPGQSGHFTITLDEESADEFLGKLQEDVGVAVVIKGPASATVLNGSFSGPLSSLLPRILPHEDLLILHGPDHEENDGVKKVIVMRAGPGPAPTINRRAPGPAAAPAPPGGEEGSTRSLLLGAGAPTRAQGGLGIPPEQLLRMQQLPNKPVSEMTDEERDLYLQQQQAIHRMRADQQRQLLCKNLGSC
jgi:hypothetical protein